MGLERFMLGSQNVEVKQGCFSISASPVKNHSSSEVTGEINRPFTSPG